jgi:hypothetical protein
MAASESRSRLRFGVRALIGVVALCAVELWAVRLFQYTPPE